MLTVGLFGITANPPHVGHCKVIELALEKLDKIYISLVYSHPFGKKFIDYNQREIMLKLILSDYFDKTQLKRILITNIEKEYVENTAKIPYSYEMLSILHEMEPETHFKLIIGEDNFKAETWKKFFKYDSIEKKFGVVVIPDQGSHSTEIREKMKNITENKEFLLHNCRRKVFEYMQENQLYFN